MSRIPDWDDLTDEEKLMVANGAIIDIDGVSYKIDRTKLDVEVFLTKTDGTKVPIEGRT